METRKYDPETDKDAVLRIYSEIGWMKDSDEARRAHEIFPEAGRTHVALIHGEPECLVINLDSTLRHLDADLPMNVVGTVATSRVARKQRLASRLTAQALAADVVEEGAILSALGMFEQGFYDRLGYGTGAYFHMVALDPATLDVPYEPRAPIRLSADDWERVHESRVARRKCHGACTLSNPQVTQVDQLCASNGFGLGFEDPKTGGITHHLWAGAENKVSGPYMVSWLAYRTRDELLELLALLAGFGDQVRLIRVPEPEGIQLQDLIRKPFQRHQISQKGQFESRTNAFAWNQVRMLDVPACLGRTRLPGPDEVTFHLELTDPIEGFLDGETSMGWRGVAGDYQVTLGPECSCERGTPADGLPRMKASVNTFTRLWLGVRPASGLAVTCPDLVLPPELLEALDAVLRLPRPNLDWFI